MTDTELIRRAAKSDPAARGQIYSEYRNFVWHISLGIAKNSQVAEDIASEVFVKVFRKINGFKFRSSFKSWLYKVAVNTALNYIKKEKRLNTLTLENTINTVPDGQSGVYDEMEDSDTVAALMGRIDEKSRLILIMREVEGMSYSDIAGSLNVKIATVKTWIYRAREELRRTYMEDMDIGICREKANIGGEQDEQYAPR